TEDGIRDSSVTGVQTCALPIWNRVTANGYCWQCITAGTSAAGGGPTSPGPDVTDGTVHWITIGTGTGVADVPFLAETSGPIGARSEERRVGDECRYMRCRASDK